MRKLYALSLTCIAMLAFCALAASPAMAEGEWLVNGEPTSIALSAETSLEFNLSDDGTGTTVLCSGIFVGTVGPGKGGEITGLTNLSLVQETTTNLAGVTVPALRCTLVTKGACTEANGSPIWTIIKNLPAIIEVALVVVNGVVLLVKFIKLHFGGNPPGYDLSCKTLLGTVTDTCTFEPGEVLANGVGDVTGEFREEEITNPPGSCSVGGTGTALIVSDGAGLTELTEGGTLSVS